MSTSSKIIAFLFGSGSSIPAGFPSTQQIKDQLLTGVGMTMRNQRYYFGTLNKPFQSIADKHINRIIVLLKEIEKVISQQDRRIEKDVSYEEIAYVIIQCYNHIMGEYDNPIVDPFIISIIPILEPHFYVGRHPEEVERTKKEYRPEVILNSEIQSYFKDARRYILDSIAGMLNRPYVQTNHLAFLKDAVEDRDYERVNIITSNNDLLVEQTLRTRGVAYLDGFVTENGKKIYKPIVYRGSCRVAMIKPHGSINWYYNPSTFQVEHSSPLEAAPYLEPYILVGTDNKLMEYSRAPYSGLLSEFYQRLQESNILVICGYGFGDKGINSQIIDWMYSDLSHRLLIIHENPELLINSSREGAIKRNLKKWRDESKLSFLEENLSISKPLEWETIKKML